jgi:hypothetical protein
MELFNAGIVISVPWKLVCECPNLEYLHLEMSQVIGSEPVLTNHLPRNLKSIVLIGKASTNEPR